MKTDAKILWFLAASVALSAVACAQTTLVGWDVNGTTESATSLSAATFAPNVSQFSPSGVLARGAGAASPGNVSSNAFGASGFNATALDNAFSASDYFTFSITVNSGYAMTLSSLTIKLNETASGPTNGALFSSVGGFASGSAAIQSFALTGGTSNDQSVTLSTGSFSNLNGTVEFRLYAYGGGSTSTDKLRIRDLSGNDLTISGTVSAIPEPGTVAAWLGAFALSAAVMARSCRKLSPRARAYGPTS